MADLISPPGGEEGGGGVPSSDGASGNLDAQVREDRRPVADLSQVPDLLPVLDLSEPPDLAPSGPPPCIPTAVDDAPDDLNVDSNCDGIDGNIERASFAASIFGGSTAASAQNLGAMTYTHSRKPVVVTATRPSMNDAGTPDSATAPVAKLDATALTATSAFVTAGGQLDNQADQDFILVKAGANGQLFASLRSGELMQAAITTATAGSGCGIDLTATASTSSGRSITLNTAAVTDGLCCVRVANLSSFTAAKPYTLILALQ